MPTGRDPALFGPAPAGSRQVVADFGGGAITSNAAALLPGAADRAIGLARRFAACFRDARAPERVEHEVATLVDHDQLRHAPVLAIRTRRPIVPSHTVQWQQRTTRGDAVRCPA